MKYLIQIVLIVSGSFAFSQVDSVFIKREMKLKVLLEDLRLAKTNSEKEAKNNIFKEYLYETLQIEGAVSYSYGNLKTLGTIKSPDNTFRLFNWNVEQDDRSNKYYCYILRFDNSKKSWKTIELVDNSKNLPPRPTEILDEKNWYGALYYKIIPVEKSNKTLYTVLAWDGNASTHTKLIDVISFTSNNKVKLGSPIFKMKDGTHKRLFFEHSSKAFMSLNYDEKRTRIIYDHLSPETPSLIGFYEYYVPDFSYDELLFEKNKWIVREDVIGVNDKASKNYTLKYINSKTGVVISKREKNVWVDPSNVNSPAGSQSHVAVLPNEEKSAHSGKEKIENKQEPKISKNTRRNEFSMNPYYNKKGRKSRK